MKTIVITGSTRGIGLGLAREFLKRGQNVIINGRNSSQVAQVSDDLAREFPKQKIGGFAADITAMKEVQELWNYAEKKFGKVDIWINNAGVMNSHLHTWDLSAQDIQGTVGINLLGSLYCSKVAIQGMIAQGGGHVYNFEGFGSNGRQFHPYMTTYGATKVAIRYLTKALTKETKGTPVKIGAISPGIVVTDLLRRPYENKPEEWKKAKKIFNILGDHVETVTPYLAQEVLKNDKSGHTISWLTFSKVMGKFLGALFIKRDLFGEKPAFTLRGETQHVAR